MNGLAVLILLVTMACSWLSRVLLLRALRLRHPEEFAALGQPSRRQLESILPQHQNLNLQFWKYLWGEKVLLLEDKHVSNLAWLARLSDTALVGSVVAFFWSAGH